MDAQIAQDLINSLNKPSETIFDGGTPQKQIKYQYKILVDKSVHKAAKLTTLCELVKRPAKSIRVYRLMEKLNSEE